MSTQYNTEPPPTSTVLLHTTAGPLTVSLFANQTPLTCRNFLQHVLDGYYTNTLFHRVSPGFVIQTGDPTSTGDGGVSVYEDREFEKYDEYWARLTGREKGEKIVFGDEVHSRLKFNRRGLVGMAKGTGEGGGYGSQFFITLGDCRQQLDGRCTMFGRIEGEGIYNVVKIAEGELVEGTERPVYPEKILSAEVVEMPKGEPWERMSKREIVAQRVVEEPAAKKKAPKKKGGKALLSFAGDDGEDEDAGVVVRPKKAKFNPALIDGNDDATSDKKPKVNGMVSEKSKTPSTSQSATAKQPAQSPPRLQSNQQIPQKRKASSPPPQPPSVTITGSSQSPPARRKPSFHDSTTQLPLHDPESPSRSASPDSDHRASFISPSSKIPSSTKNLEAEIAALKASMRRDTGATTTDSKNKKSVLESLIPETSTRGRKRPRPGDTTGGSKDDASALAMLNAFRRRLEDADEGAVKPSAPASDSRKSGQSQGKKSREKGIDGSTIEAKSKNGNTTITATKSSGRDVDKEQQEDDDDEEAQLCDLHFIANCQSCSSWDKKILSTDYEQQPNQQNTKDHVGANGGPDSAVAGNNLSNPDDDGDDGDRSWMTHSLSFAKDRLGKDLTWKKKGEDELVVIDPREKEREVLGKGKGRERDRERDRRKGKVWDDDAGGGSGRGGRRDRDYDRGKRDK